jgi:hypothetical protein
MKKWILLLLAATAAIAFAEKTAYLQLGVLSGTGQTAAADLGYAAHKHTVQVTTTGSPSSCSIQLEGTLDDIYAVSSPQWANLSGSQTCTSNVTFHVADRPVRAVRANLTALSGGSSPTVSAKYLGVQ